MAVRLLETADAVALWPEVRKELDRAYEYSFTDEADDHFSEVEQGRAQVWALDFGYALTRVIDTKRGRALQYMAIGGDYIDSWLQEFLDKSQEWAKGKGCGTAILSGRRGWEKKLNGFKLERVALTKEL